MQRRSNNLRERNERQNVAKEQLYLPVEMVVQLVSRNKEESSLSKENSSVGVVLEIPRYFTKLNVKQNLLQ